ncbi:hypothetical protein C366_00660 [Cryptococcus neoformans Tu401-1]|nr:hypothetical protein C365_00656 [Cryptococcus neoformans var. grubii Bt85]OXG23281.1 hypothetical protein C366_00660 [Cryptococcus neoformans var. grubii Tu401-1]OXM81688.1 hypothetical protein C364_00659 [Cryptococcus neoformans var. grubii Bt63]
MDIPKGGESSNSSLSQSRADQSVFEEFESYPFNNDPEFRAGLPTVISAIRGKKLHPSSIDEMLSRAQWFYFTRKKNISLPWESYARHSQMYQRAANTNSSSSALAQLDTLAEARRMLTAKGETGQQGMSFEMLVRLIKEGKADRVETTPVPDELNEGTPSQPIMTRRPKPWERPSVQAGDPGDMMPPPVVPSDADISTSSTLKSITPSIAANSSSATDTEGLYNNYGQMSEEDMALIFGDVKGDEWIWEGGGEGLEQQHK